jgi:VWFA-related protein
MNEPKNRILLCVSILLISVVSISLPAPAQSTQQDQATLHQTVRNVLVDVVVTDRDGNPVHGLPADKFQVLDNGSPRKLAFFEEHRAAAAPPVHLPPLHLPPNVYTNFDEVPANGPAIVLLIDALNTPQADQMRVRQAIVDTLQEIPAGTQIAVFSLNEKLRLIRGFNGDPAVLKAALAKAMAWQKQSRLTDDPGQDSYYGGSGDPLNGSASVAAAAVGIEGTLVAHEQAFRVRERIALTL